jgi:hydroxymethylpyrimidine pyrophosphatase-like HAD family hydrolase
MHVGPQLRALAVDFDGTLTMGGRPADEALAALARFRGMGRQTLLVTGRIWDELLGVFPDVVAHFDLIVAENGAVLFHNGILRPIAERVDPLLDERLRAAGVPFRRGRVLLATTAAHAVTVAVVKADVGVECQLVRNRGELMLLPPGVTKGWGVTHALSEAGLSHHSTYAVGDAENDYSLLAACEVGVAVANAIEHVRERADLVTGRPDGAGIVELLHGDVVSGRRVLHPARWHIDVGIGLDGRPVRIPSSSITLLVTGPSGSGKSYVAGLLAERLIRLDYTLLISDPEGDYERVGDLPGVIRLGGVPLPPPEQIASLLSHRAGSIVLDLSEVSPDARAELFAHLPPVIEAYRAARGLPHWVLLDEAHQPLGASGPSRQFFTPGHGYCIVTYVPEDLSDTVLRTLDVSVLLPGTRVTDRVRRLARWPGDALDRALDALVPGQILVVRRPGLASDAPEVQVAQVGARETLHVRHRHKYVAGMLPPHMRFRFYAAEGRDTGAVAGNLAEFHRELARCHDDVLRHHAGRHDFSRWFDHVFTDEDLATAVRRIEDEVEIRGDPNESREALLLEIETRYLAAP